VNGRRSRENRCRKWFTGPHRNEKLQTEYFDELKHFSIASSRIMDHVQGRQICVAELFGSRLWHFISYICLIYKAEKGRPLSQL